MYQNHTYQDTTNELLIYNDNQGSIRQLFARRYLSEDVGKLISILQETFDHIGRVHIRRRRFTLVNVYYTRTGYSYGKCPPPPDEVIRPNCQLILTFSFNGFYDVGDEYDPQFHQRLLENCFIWGEDITSFQNYLTVSIPMNTVLDLGLRPMYTSNLSYLYNVISILTKNMVLKFTCPYLDNVNLNYQKYWNLNILQMLKRYNYKCLLYNKQAWEYIPNLFTNMIDNNAALFFFLHIFNQVVFEHSEGDLLEKILFGEENSIQSLLSQSISEYNEDRESENLLFVASLYGESCTGENYYNKLRVIHYQSNFNLRPEHANLIMNGDITVNNLEGGIV